LPKEGLIGKKKEANKAIQQQKQLEHNDNENLQNSSEAEILDNVVLNIKALMLLDTSEESLQQLIDTKLSNSHDEEIKRFLKLTRSSKNEKGSTRDYFLVAIGELLIASFLIISGLATLLPSVFGLSSPQELVNFIAQITSKISVQTLSDPMVPGLELLLAILLLLGAFHAVRLAALNLRKIENVSHPVAAGF
jgi:hypothetical protein